MTYIDDDRKSVTEIGLKPGCFDRKYLQCHCMKAITSQSIHSFDPGKRLLCICGEICSRREMGEVTNFLHGHKSSRVKVPNHSGDLVIHCVHIMKPTRNQAVLMPKEFSVSVFINQSSLIKSINT